MNAVDGSVTYFVLETMSSSLHVHLFGVGISKLAFTQLAVVTDDDATFIVCFLNVLLTYVHIVQDSFKHTQGSSS